MDNKQKKILYVANITRSVNCFFIPHLNMLINEGYIVDCACKMTGERPIHEEKLIGNVNFYDIPVTKSTFKLKNFNMLYKLYKLQKANKYDIIHLHSPIVGAYGRLLKLMFPSVKMIYTAHGYHFHKRSSKKSWLIFHTVEKFLSKFTDVLVTINKEDYEVSKSFACKKLINVHGVGVDTSEFNKINEAESLKLRQELGLEEDDFVLVMVGEHNTNKNQVQLIHAMEEIAKIDTHVKALLVGDGIMLEENQAYVKKNNMRNVKVLGFREDINEIINASDVLVSLSYREGLPKNVLEAIFNKKPVIGTNTRGINELVINGENGYLVEVGDVDKTIESILALKNLSNEKLLKMGEKSYDLAQKYSIERVLEEMKPIYTS